MKIKNKITLFRNAELEIISEATGLTENEICERVINNLDDLNILHCLSDCGKLALAIIEEAGEISKEGFINLCFPDIKGKAYALINRSFDGVMLWGLDDDCPRCGNEMKGEITGADGIEWEDSECTVCGFETTQETDWDSMPGGKDYCVTY